MWGIWIAASNPPPPNVVVIVAIGQWVGPGNYRKDGKWRANISGRYAIHKGITHWMPMPDPPGYLT